MTLVDTNGTIHTDEPEVLSEQMKASLTSPANDYSRMVLDKDYNILYRFTLDGSLDLFYIGDKPFRRVRLKLLDRKQFREDGELIREDFRVLRRGDAEVTIATGRTLFALPLELMTRW